MEHCSFRQLFVFLRWKEREREREALELVQEVESSSREETVHACNARNACIRSVRNNASIRFIVR